MAGTYPDHDARDREIVRLYTAGESVLGISRITGVAHTTVSNVLDERRVGPMHAPGRARVGDRKELALSTEEIVRRYEAGASIMELAKLCCTVEQTIRRRLTSSGVAIRPQVNVRSALPAQEAVQAYEEGMSLSELADRYGVSPSTVRQLLLENGVTMRPPRRAKATTAAPQREPRTPVLTPQQQDEAVRLYRDGASERSIATTLGVSRTPIQKLLEERGILRRRSVQSELPAEELARRHAAGETAAALAREFGAGVTTVKRKIKQYNDSKGIS